MSKYLERYIGIYRVKAHYDLNTMDYPRDDFGNIDPSFDDYYIDCYGGIEIRHADRDLLACYVPNVTKGKNILRQIYLDKYSKKCNNIKTVYTQLYQDGIIRNIDITDGEVYFTFKADLLDYFKKFIRIKTNGANIRPLSVKNLPRTPYIIPEKDMKLYKKAVENINPLDIGRIVRQYSGLHPEYKAEMRKQGLNIKQYAHKIGQWEEFCKFVSDTI